MKFDNDTLYPMVEAAKVLNIHPNTLRNYRLEGRVKVVQIGKNYRISGSEINYILENGLRPVTEEYRDKAAKAQAEYRERKAAKAAKAPAKKAKAAK